MSSSTVHNLLKGTGSAVVTNKEYYVVDYHTAKPLVIGKTYTISAYVEKLERSPLDDVKGGKPVLAVYDGGCWWSPGTLAGDVPGQMTLTFTYKQQWPDHFDPTKIVLFNTPPGGEGIERTASLHDVMLVEGTEPAAWAPAEGETLAGGGVLS